MRTWLRPGAALIAVGAASLSIGVVWSGRGGAAHRPVGAALAAAQPAVKPFRRLTATRIVVGKTPPRCDCRPHTERTQGCGAPAHGRRALRRDALRVSERDDRDLHDVDGAGGARHRLLRRRREGRAARCGWNRAPAPTRRVPGTRRVASSGTRWRTLAGDLPLRPAAQPSVAVHTSSIPSSVLNRIGRTNGKQAEERGGAPAR